MCEESQNAGSRKKNNDPSGSTHNLLLQSLLRATDPRPNMKLLIVKHRNNWDSLICSIGSGAVKEKWTRAFFWLGPSEVWAWDASFSTGSGSLLGHLVGSALYRMDVAAGSSCGDEQQTKWWWSVCLWSAHSCLLSHSSTMAHWV